MKSRHYGQYYGHPVQLRVATHCSIAPGGVG